MSTTPPPEDPLHEESQTWELSAEYQQLVVGPQGSSFPFMYCLSYHSTEDDPSLQTIRRAQRMVDCRNACMGIEDP